MNRAIIEEPIHKGPLVGKGMWVRPGLLALALRPCRPLVIAGGLEAAAGVEALRVGGWAELVWLFEHDWLVAIYWRGL